MLGKKIVGIYSIYCIENNKIYIGQSRNIRKRFNKHYRQLRKNTHENQHLQRSWDKYGEDSFLFDVITTTSIENLTNEENYFISFYNSIKNGFNQVRGGECRPDTKPRKKRGSKGFKHSEETKALIREYHYTKRCKIHPLKGRTLPEETKKKISLTKCKSRYFLRENGEIIKVDNIKLFAKENFLSSECLFQLSRGEIYSHKEYYKPPENFKELSKDELISFIKTVKDNKFIKNCKSFTFLDKNNNKIKVFNLKRFCKENKLLYGAMFFVYHNINRYKSHKGYTTGKHFDND